MNKYSNKTKLGLYFYKIISSDTSPLFLVVLPLTVITLLSVLLKVDFLLIIFVAYMLLLIVCFLFFKSDYKKQDEYKLDFYKRFHRLREMPIIQEKETLKEAVDEASLLNLIYKCNSKKGIYLIYDNRGPFFIKIDVKNIFIKEL